MAKNLSLDEIRGILESGDLDQLVGVIENYQVECKKAPYHLVEESHKREFAKDVSGLANASGGLILLGAETIKDPTHSGDEISTIHLFRQERVDQGRYMDVLQSWVYPTLKNVVIKWFKSINDPQEGIVAIDVPLQPETQRPFLITKTAEVNSKSGKVKMSEVLFGYAERRRDETPPTSVQEIQARLKDGLHFSSLNEQLESIQETLQSLQISRQSFPTSSPYDLLDERIGLVLSELELGESAPTYILAAAPKETVEIPGLFASKDTEIVRILQRVHALRPSGFNIDTRGRAARIVGGNRRRSLEPKDATLNLWRGGMLIFAEDAVRSVCWQPVKKIGTPLRINQLAMIETVFLFAEMSRLVFKDTCPQPSEILYRLEFRNITVSGTPCGLVPGVPGDDNWRFGHDIHRAPDSKVRADVRWPSSTIDAGRVAYRLACSVYEQFGMEHDMVPYTEKAGSDFVISPAEIKRLHNRS